MSQGYTFVRSLEATRWREPAAAIEAKPVRREDRPRRVHATRRPNLLRAATAAYGAALLKTFEGRS